MKKYSKEEYYKEYIEKGIEEVMKERVTDKIFAIGNNEVQTVNIKDILKKELKNKVFKEKYLKKLKRLRKRKK